MLPKVFIEGKTFGDIQILKQFHIVNLTMPTRRRIWIKALCRCGKIFECMKSNVLAGKTTSCGRCHLSRDLWGKHFANYLVLSLDHGKLGNIFVECTKCHRILSKKTILVTRKKGPYCKFCSPSKKEKKTRPLREVLLERSLKKHEDSANWWKGKKLEHIKIIKFSHWEESPKRKRAIYLCRCNHCGKKFLTRHLYENCGCGCRNSGFQRKGIRFSFEDLELIHHLVSNNIYLRKEVALLFKTHPSYISKLLKKYKDLS